MISYLNESHSDVVFGPCRRDISIAVEGLRMPYICTTFDPEVEVFKFQILPALSDFIEAMRKFVYGQCRRGGDGEYKTIIYEGNKGTQHSTTQWNVILTLKSHSGFTDLFNTIFFSHWNELVCSFDCNTESQLNKIYLNLKIKKHP